MVEEDIKVIFADGQDICLYAGGKVQKYPSKFIEKYKETAAAAERSSSWKYSGEGARYRGDVMPEQRVESRITGVHLTANGNEGVYSFVVNRTSGVYKRDFSDEKLPETHVINSVEHEYSGGCLNASSNKLALSLKRNYINSDIAIFDLDNFNYVTVTEGDTIDEDPFYSPVDSNIIYFSSRGVGRDLNGDYIGLSPASVVRMNMNTMSIDEVKSSQKFSYFKPVEHGGRLYAIKAPAGEKKTNPVVAFFLIPVRFLQAIANLISIFIHAFTGKSLTSGGNNPAKGREYDSRKEYVRGNIINIDKELKTNAGKKDKDYGFVPLSWQLICLDDEKVLASGVADYDITDNGTIIYTNGRHVFALKDGKRTKLCDAQSCVTLSVRHNFKAVKEPFGF